MPQTFKDRLKSFKKKNDLKGKDLAEAGEISPQSVSAYSDASLPRAEVLAKWANKLNLNLNWLLTGKGEMLRSEHAQTPSPADNHEKMELLQENRELHNEIRQLRKELDALKQAIASGNLNSLSALGGPTAARSSRPDSE